MKKGLLDINCQQEKGRIVEFLRETFAKQNINKVIIGLSGGIDSTVVFYLLKAVLPAENIIVAHLYYFEPALTNLEKVIKMAQIQEQNIHILSIKHAVEEAIKTLHIEESEANEVRIGNIAARMRMICLFDLAKKNKALVCGTENKTENLLGYFTRFGDQASDIEPIQHLYKTQVYQLGEYLGVPEEILKQTPTAGLWQGQTDEGEFGFSYEEADQVLYLFFEKQLTVGAIINKGLANAEKIISWSKQNKFKHETPYHL